MLSEISQVIKGQPFSNDEQIAVVRIEQWLDWATGIDANVVVALPVIQRGSVWSSDKVVTLWDSLLRAMPIGSFTVSSLKSGLVRVLGGQRAEERTNPPPGSLALLDGQQRTLAMCIGWGGGAEMDRRVWVDFGQSGADGHRFCLRATTKFQPFGFSPENQSQRLPLWQRRTAREQFDSHTHSQHEADSDHQLPLDQTRPYGALHPLELRGLIKRKRMERNLETWTSQTIDQLEPLRLENRAEIAARVKAFGLSLDRFFGTQIALVRIDDELLEDDELKSGEQFLEPPLVVLFERIANGGSRLSPSDYVFALIKHRFPEAHNLVQTLHRSGTVGSLLSANELVMTAVRVAAATHEDDEGKPFPDNPAPSPREFNRLVRRRLIGGQDFLGGAVRPLIGKKTEDRQRQSLLEAFKYVQQVLEYRPNESRSDPGFPRLAFPQFQRQLVQVLVYWIHQRLRSSDTDDVVSRDIECSRPEILRFVLFWLLCMNGKEKDREAAGKEAFKTLRDEMPTQFPGKRIAELLHVKKLAISVRDVDSVRPLLCPARLTGAEFIASLWVRREAALREGSIPDVLQLAVNWVSRSNLLLWLQRRGLTTNPAYYDTDPLAGPERDQETPYDYDHITPCRDWARDGRFSGKALYEFCQNGDNHCLGNNIGNYRLIDRGSNRSDGEDSPVKKFAARDDQKPPRSRAEVLCESDINDEEAAFWVECSPETRNCRIGEWDVERAQLFKQVVEQRACRLYQRFYSEGGFEEWQDCRRGTVSLGEVLQIVTG